MSFGTSVHNAGGRDAKLIVDSLTSLATVANEPLVDGDSSDESSIDGSSADAHSYGAEAADSEAGQAFERAECQDDDDRELEAILEFLGLEDCLEGGELLSAHESNLNLNAFRPVEPPRYRSLFWRQYLASRQRKMQITPGRLRAHDKAQKATNAEDAPTRGAGDWLSDFKTVARMVPVVESTSEVLGADVGPRVAAFVGHQKEATHSELPASDLSAGETRDGRRLLGSLTTRFAACVPHGRTTFMFDDEVSIYTPDHRSVASEDLDSEISVIDMQFGR